MNGLEELVSILQKTLSPDQAGLDFAAHWLETNTGPHLVGGLLAVLLEDQLESGVRRQAGLQLRRLLTNQQVWHQLGNLRAEVRRGLVEVLAKENWRPSVVALCVKQVASLESWPGIVPALVARLASNQEMEVLATLDTLAGLLELENEMEEAEMSLFLTTVVSLIKNSTLMRVRVAAYGALEASGKKVAGNMARRNERDYLMQLLCEGSQSVEEEESGAALSCLVQLASLYSPVMSDYISPALLPITLQALHSKSAAKARQGANFWASMIEQEEEEEEDTEGGIEFATTYLPHMPALVEGLVASLICLAEAGDLPGRPADCLILLCRHCPTSAPHSLLNLVPSLLASEDWHLRCAGVISLGCLAHCPHFALDSATRLSEAGPSLLSDSSPGLRSAVGWSLKQVTSLLPLVVNERVPILGLLGLVAQALAGAAGLVEDSCRSLSHLAPHLGHPSAAHLLPQVLAHFFPLLLHVAASPTLALPALVALEDLAPLSSASPQCHQLLSDSVSYLLDMLGSPSCPNSHHSIIVTCLHSLLPLLPSDQLAERAGRAASLLLPLLSLPEAEEDVLACLGPVVESLGPSCLPLLPTLLPPLCQAIGQEGRDILVSVALGLLGDLSRALGPQFAPYCTSIMPYLLTCLTISGPNSDLLFCLSDIVLALGSAFTPHCSSLLTLLPPDPGAHLREASIELYGSLLQGAKEDTELKTLLQSHTETMASLCSQVARGGEEITDKEVLVALGLLGDLASVMGDLGWQETWVEELINRGDVGGEEAKRLAAWAKTELEKVSGSQACVMKKACMEEVGEDGDVVYSMRVTVTSRQFVTQEVESESVTLRLRPEGGVREVATVEATLKLPPPREELRRSRKRPVREGGCPAKRWRDEEEEEDGW